MNVTDFARQILELESERDYWRSKAIHYEEEAKDSIEHINASVEGYEQLWGTLLIAALDPDSGINRAQRAVQRDPLKGALTAAGEQS